MASPPPAPLRMIESSRVSPPPGSVPESSTPLTFFDVFWINTSPVERVFFYQFPHLATSQFTEFSLPVLKISLSLTLQQFYPLVGKIRLVPESEDRHEIHYVDGDSVAFTVAECNDKDFDEISGSHARDASMLLPFVSQLPLCVDAQPLLALQVTLFPKQGVAIGITLHHAACDGSASMHFMSSWASRCRSEGSASALAPPPILDRTLIADPRGMYSVFFKEPKSQNLVSSVDLPKWPTTSSEKVVASFTLEGDQIKRLKEFVLAKEKHGGGDGASALQYSRISVAFAYVWVCLVKARCYEGERDCHFFFVGNCRSGLRPPVPPQYFGNCLASIFVATTKARDLIGADGLMVAAKAICSAIRLFKKDPLHRFEECRQRARFMFRHQPLTVAGSPRLKVYELDIGWGKPKKVEVVSIVKMGAMSVAESRDAGGGLEIGLALPKDEMDAFATHFNRGLI